MVKVRKHTRKIGRKRVRVRAHTRKTNKRKNSFFIQNALKHGRPGALSKQLGIQTEDKIPMTLLNKIIKAESGDTIRNPTTKGKKTIKITRKLERRAILARTLKNIATKRKKR